jgi:endonuclease YncB( thermonuclease family)
MEFADEHDWINYPELTNTQIELYGLLSPHEQITHDFVGMCVKVHDGDTITIRTDFRNFDFPVRFSTIDAPELNTGEPGEIARDWLKEQIEGQEVEIKINPQNRVEKWGRLLGDVFCMGMSLGDTEISLGLAVPYGKAKEGEVPNLDKVLKEQI